MAAHDIAALIQYKGLTVAEAAQIVIHENRAGRRPRRRDRAGPARASGNDL